MGNSAEGVIRAAAEACEYARRYECIIDIDIGASIGRPPVKATVTPRGILRDPPKIEEATSEQPTERSLPAVRPRNEHR